jgi:hypothetical protein
VTPRQFGVFLGTIVVLVVANTLNGVVPRDIPPFERGVLGLLVLLTATVFASLFKESR